MVVLVDGGAEDELGNRVNLNNFNRCWLVNSSSASPSTSIVILYINVKGTINSVNLRRWRERYASKASKLNHTYCHDSQFKQLFRFTVIIRFTIVGYRMRDRFTHVPFLHPSSITE